MKFPGAKRGRKKGCAVTPGSGRKKKIRPKPRGISQVAPLKPQFESGGIDREFDFDMSNFSGWMAI